MSQAVTVWTKDDCPSCVSTKRLLDRKQIPHRTVFVADDDTEKIEQLRRVADEMGVPLTMPYVHVYDDETTDAAQWFGHRPDQIVQHIISKRAGRS